MHINNNSQKNDINNIYKLKQAQLLQTLKQGSIFKGQIVNITNNTVSLKLLNGSSLEAKTLKNIDFKIGSIVDFEVKSNNDSKLIIKPCNMEGTSKSNMILDVLQEANLKMSDENIKLVNMLIKNKMPVDTNSISKFNVDIKGNDGFTVELLDFMLQNNIELEPKIMSHLKGYSQNNIKIASQIESLVNNLVSNRDDKSIQEAIKTIFENEVDVSNEKDNGSKKQKIDELKNKLMDKFTFNVSRDENIKNLSKLYKTIFKDISTLESMISAKDNKGLGEEISNIKDNIDFMQNINDKVCLLQIPLQFSNGLLNGDLYVMDDKDEHNLSTNNKIKTAVLALDLFKLGHFESFLVLDEKILSCNINVESEKIKTLITDNINMLRKGLNNKGIILKNVNIAVNASKFNFIDSKKEDYNNKKEDKRYSFDMRV